MSRLDVFKAAVQLTVEGDAVTLASLKGPEGEEFHVTPRKYSKKDAARIRKLLMQSSGTVPASVQAKLLRLHKDGATITEEMLAGAMTDEEMLMLYQVADPESAIAVEREKLMRGIAEHDLGDVPGPMTAEIADLILDSRDVADEILAAVDALNPFSVTPTPS